MQGYPTAPNHKQRYEAQLAALGKYPAITVVDGDIDDDDIETARQQASAVPESHPDLSGYLCCDASGPIDIASAIKNAGRAGKVKVVGMDRIKPILAATKEAADPKSEIQPKRSNALFAGNGNIVSDHISGC